MASNTRTHAQSSSQQMPNVNDINKIFEFKIEEFLQSASFKEVINVAVSNAVKAAIDCFKNVIDKSIQTAIDAAVAPLQKIIGDLRKDLNVVQIKANDNEQYSRRCNLRSYRINEDEDEDCSVLVREFCSREL